MSKKLNVDIDKRLTESELRSRYFGSVPPIPALAGDEKQLMRELLHLQRVPRVSSIGYLVLDFSRQDIAMISSEHPIFSGEVQGDIVHCSYLMIEQAIPAKCRSLACEMHQAATCLLARNQWQLSEATQFFSCRIRMHALDRHPNTAQMRYLQFVPIPTNQRVRYLLCLIYPAAINLCGELRLYHKDKSFDEWQSRTGQWKHFEPETISPREKDILQLARACWRTKEIAHKLGISTSTVSNIELELYRRWGVDGINAAVLYATNRGMIA